MTQSNAGLVGIILTALLLLFGIAGVSAQEQPCLRRTVTASVLTPTGRPVVGVPASSFKAQFRGRPVRILSATRDLGPRRIVVLLDASGSMLQPSSGKWQLARRAVNDIAIAAPAEYQVALVIFASKVEAVVGFAEGRRAVAAKVTALDPGLKGFPKGERRTALYDAILEGLALLQPTQQGDVIYAVTDSGENASHATFRKVEQGLAAAGVRLFTFLLLASGWPRGLLTPEESVGPENMQRLVQHTGGSILNVGSFGPNSNYNLDKKEKEALSRSVRLLYTHMAQFYRLEVELPQPVDKPREWKLEMVNERGARMKGWQATYQGILMPCTALRTQ